MSTAKAITLAFVLLLLMGQLQSVRCGEMVKYGPTNRCVGYLAKPEGRGPFPALIVVHEWWGLNDNIKAEADKLAETGYVALAVDLFGRVTEKPQEAAIMVRNVNQQTAIEQLNYALQYLRFRRDVQMMRVGAIGWCFGGGYVLKLAIANSKLAAAVIYYGQPITDIDTLKQIKAPVIGFFGEDDQSIPMEKVREFEQALRKAEVRYRIYTYPGAGHAFANPTRTESYRPEAAADAWKKTLDFLKKYLSPPVVTTPLARPLQL